MAGTILTYCSVLFVCLMVIAVVTAEQNSEKMNSNDDIGSAYLDEGRYLLPLDSVPYRRSNEQTVPYFMKRQRDIRTRLLRLLQKSDQQASKINKRPFDSISYQTGLGELF
ncbi:hypothetical protein ACF0H5_019737 [Mactra antiquata]